MITATIHQPTSRDIADRAERGLALLEERGDEIRQIGLELYRVPSCSGRKTYSVLR